jgi:hypothetical protein
METVVAVAELHATPNWATKLTTASTATVWATSFWAANHMYKLPVYVYIYIYIYIYIYKYKYIYISIYRGILKYIEVYYILEHIL